MTLQHEGETPVFEGKLTSVFFEDYLNRPDDVLKSSEFKQRKNVLVCKCTSVRDTHVCAISAVSLGLLVPGGVHLFAARAVPVMFPKRLFRNSVGYKVLDDRQ